MNVNTPHASETPKRRGRQPGEPGRRGNPRLCGAKNRAGEPCRALAIKGRTRCRLHGGRSPAGIGHPRYVHGFYSRYPLARFVWLRRAAVLRSVLIADVLESTRGEAFGARRVERMREVIDLHQVGGRTLMRWAGVTPADVAALSGDFL